MNGNGLTIVLINIHGLFRSHNLELGRDADTGGQTKYVLEYARALGEQRSVSEVLVLTRYIKDKRVSPDYAQEEEKITEKVRIIRIKCGGSRYIRKEKLWPYLDTFVDNTLQYLKSHDIHPDILHSHYVDAGYVAMELSTFLNIPFVHTGHSLGLPKKQKLRQTGMSQKRINAEYRIDHRISVENRINKRALFITTSTSQEINEQYSLYETGPEGTYFVNPPGIDLEQFYPYYYLEAKECMILDKYDHYLQARNKNRNELERFLVQPDRPMILTICRPEKRKNIEGLITAFGQDKELQYIANLAIFAGIRKDLTEKDKPENQILIDMLLLMDKFDLYGKMAIPKKHDFEFEVPELYRYAAELRGVFVNSAYHEPFGLTLLEAAASGLPIVTTNNGGPLDIVENCQNGHLVDVTDPNEISAAIKKILTDKELWTEYSNNGINNVKEYYSWSAHSEKFIDELKRYKIMEVPSITAKKENSLKRKLESFGTFLVTDIDNTLIGNTEKLQGFLDWFIPRRSRIGFAVATGRDIDSARDILDYNNVPQPDLFITSVGTEIYYHFDEAVFDKGWESHIQKQWEPEKIQNILEEVSFLAPQTDQRAYKVSYYFHDYTVEKLKEIHRLLKENACHYTLILTEGRLVDIIPARASKQKAILYLCKKWNISEEHVIVAGDSGNDRDMLQKFKNSVVVANHQKELNNMKNVYYSPRKYAEAIVDGFHHFRLAD